MTQYMSLIRVVYIGHTATRILATGSDHLGHTQYAHVAQTSLHDQHVYNLHRLLSVSVEQQS